jgi:glycosyltransferase involved in cell wall biosynthesis
MQTEGKPARVVLNVAMRAGLLALWLKYTRGVPFILIEHWSGYLPEDGRYHGKWLRKATELVFKEADGVMTVSKQMRDNMVSRHGLAMKRHAILPNSVDVDIFSYIPENQLIESPFFYHVSNFVHEKNVLALVAVFEQCWNEGMQYRLILSGDGPDATTVKNRYIHRIEEGKLQLTGRLTPEKIASYMQQATAFVLFSLFEGLPCVMLEAWCTGLPVIAPATGGIPEVLNSDNGILLPTNDSEALYKAVWAIDRGALTFDRLQIHTQAKAKYASSSVGQTLFNFLQLNNE